VHALKRCSDEKELLVKGVGRIDPTTSHDRPLEASGLLPLAWCRAADTAIFTRDILSESEDRTGRKWPSSEGKFNVEMMDAVLMRSVNCTLCILRKSVSKVR
jgi:hypothetical protein